MSYQSWIKIEVNTIDKPEVLAIAEHLKIDEYAVLGKLTSLWIWFDSQTKTGCTSVVSKETLDTKVKKKGFCDAMIKVNWMIEKDGSIILPNFDRHNGLTAKKRADGNRRVAKKRAKEKQNTNQNVTNVTELPTFALQRALPDEDVDIDIDTDRYTAVADIKKDLNNAGIPDEWNDRENDKIIIDSWIKMHLTEKILSEAIKRADRSKQSKAFGVSYLQPIVKQIMTELRKPDNPANNKSRSRMSEGVRNAQRYEESLNR